QLRGSDARRGLAIAFVTIAHTIAASSQATASCAPGPRLGCAVPFGGIALVKEGTPGRERMKIAFKGPAPGLQLSEAGNPTSGSTRYDVCFYDGGGALAGTLTVDRAGATCGAAAKPCWQPIGDKGYRYKDPDASADGMQKMVLIGGVMGHGKVSIKAGNAA